MAAKRAPNDTKPERVFGHRRKARRRLEIETTGRDKISCNAKHGSAIEAELACHRCVLLPGLLLVVAFFLVAGRQHGKLECLAPSGRNQRTDAAVGAGPRRDRGLLSLSPGALPSRVPLGLLMEAIRSVLPDPDFLRIHRIRISVEAFLLQARLLPAGGRLLDLGRGSGLARIPSRCTATVGKTSRLPASRRSCGKSGTSPRIRKAHFTR